MLSKLGMLSSNQYSQERRDAALRFRTGRDADNALRAWSGRRWIEAPRSEKTAINIYTGGAYEDYNIPLNGFDGRYGASNFKGVGNVDIDCAGMAPRLGT